MSERSYVVSLTRDEVRRLAGALREGAEWIEEYEERNGKPLKARLHEAERMHKRATELYEIAEKRP